MTRRPGTLLFLSAFALALASVRAPAGPPPAQVVEAGSDQTVTVRGDFPSLERLIEEVCRLSAVELRAFDAPDRPASVAYAGVRLAEALEGLLREESYLVGVAPGPAGQPVKVRWLRVVGRNLNAHSHGATTAKGKENPPLPVTSFAVPATLGGMEFSSEDPEQRARVLEAVATRLVESGALQGADPAAIARSLAEYPDARRLVTQLRDAQSDAALRGRLDAILAALP